jgi:hypothetical protein
MKAARILGILLIATLPAAVSLGAPSTIVGTIVEVRPDTGAIVLRVGLSEGEDLLRRFRVADSTRFRVDGGFARFADIVVGQTARIQYVRANGANVAELIDVTLAPPASSTFESARDATGIEERRRYLDEVARTLDVLDESVQELSQYPDIEGTEALARQKATVETLETQIADARALLDSLSATDSQEVWSRGVDQMGAALRVLSATHERGWSLVANR